MQAARPSKGTSILLRAPHTQCAPDSGSTVRAHTRQYLPLRRNTRSVQSPSGALICWTSLGPSKDSYASAFLQHLLSIWYGSCWPPGQPRSHQCVVARWPLMPISSRHAGWAAGPTISCFWQFPSQSRRGRSLPSLGLAQKARVWIGLGVSFRLYMGAPGYGSPDWLGRAPPDRFGMTPHMATQGGGPGFAPWHCRAVASICTCPMCCRAKWS